MKRFGPLFLLAFVVLTLSCGVGSSRKEGRRSSAVATALLAGGAASSVTSGDYHSCALLPGGTVQCWGGNPYGEVGVGQYGGNYPTPVTVPGLSGVKSIAGSTSATCALLSDGTVQCWGYGYGPTPVAISGVTGATNVSVSGSSWTHGCAVMGDTTVRCWGDNSWGQLGNGTSVDSGGNANSTISVPVSNLTGAIAVQASAYSTCALLSNGTVQCWGDNSAYQLGIGTPTAPSTCYAPYNWPCSTVPMQVVGLTSAIAIASGDGWHTCALLSGGTVQCWGLNDYGQLGDGTTTARTSPVPVTGLGGSVTAIAGGMRDSCAVLSTGAVQCWGRNNSGQLGNGTTTDAHVPVDALGVSGAGDVSTGFNHSCALLSGGAGVVCWGDNAYGELGTGTTFGSPIGVPARTGANPVAITAGDYHSCALLPGGTVQCWGGNPFGEIGVGQYGGNYPSPVTVPGISGATAISGSTSATCALLSDGTVQCWGYGYGPTPVAISGVTGATSVSVSGSSWTHGCAVMGDSTVRCWGDNSWGQLGNGTSVDSGGNANSTVSVPVSNLTGAIAVQASAYSTCALLSNGTVQCWGDNGSYELGIGTATAPNTCYAPYNWPCSTVPMQVVGLSGAVALASGDGWHTCALLSDGTVQCWGTNGNGQLGDGTTTSRTSPVPVAGLGGTVTALAAGTSHSCAVLATGAMQCWGGNASGQLGDGSTTDSAVPETVSGVSSAIAVSAGFTHTCALLGGIGGISCWGDNSYGELGDGGTTNSPTPVIVPGVTPHGSQTLQGYVTPDIAAAPLVGPVPATQQLRLTIALPVQVPSGFPALADFAQQVSDPTNAMYRQFLTPDQYAAYYQPDSFSYAALQTYVESFGLTVTNAPSDNEIMDVTGTAAQIEQMIFANLNVYLRPDGTPFFAPDRDPSLAAPIQVLNVAGLKNDKVPRPALGPTGPTVDTKTGENDLWGNDFRNAYFSGCAAPNVDGTGQTIGLLEFESFNKSDAVAYATRSGIRDPSLLISTVTETATTDSTVPGGTGEAAVDVELAHAMAPGAQIVVFTAPEPQDLNSPFQYVDFIADLFHLMVHPPSGVRTPTAISSSWSDLGDDPSVRQSLAALAATGVSFFQASGDAGAFTGNPQDLRAMDNVTVVGGTHIRQFVSGAAPIEAAWPGSGGGSFGPVFKQIFAQLPEIASGVDIPAYQVPIASGNPQASTQYRNFPDVSMAAQWIADVWSTDGDSPQDQPSSGTSASAPLWAGFTALVNQVAQSNRVPRVGFANPVLYKIAGNAGLYAQSFNDIVSGSPNQPNPGAAPPSGEAQDIKAPPPAGGYSATTGYDLETGLGSPKCQLMLQLSSSTPTVPFSCPSGQAVCGTVCCASGMCNNLVCQPAPVLEANAHPNEAETVDLCISGAGFAPGSSVSVMVTEVPLAFAGTTSFSKGPVTAGSDGSVTASFPGSGTQVNCSDAEAMSQFTITATNGLGQSASVSLPACVWCSTPNGCHGTGTCP